VSGAFFTSFEGEVEQARKILASEGRLALSGLVGPTRLLLPHLVGPPPLLVVVPTEREVERAAEDLRTLAGLPGILTLPAPGPAPFRGLPRHP
jgi:hypothetical protein